jgi:hypothetical protein
MHQARLISRILFGTPALFITVADSYKKILGCYDNAYAYFLQRGGGRLPENRH